MTACPVTGVVARCCTRGAEEPVDHGLVESKNVITQNRQVMLDEAFGERAIEAFNGAVHLETAWARVVVAYTESDTGIMEQVGELGSVVF